MKNLPLVISIVSLLGVGYLLMNQSPKVADTAQATEITEESSEVPKIVFVNADTLLLKYEKFQERKKEIEAKEKKEDKALKARGRSLEKEVGELQKKMMELEQEAQQGNLSRQDYEARAKKLVEKQQKLAAKEQRLVADQQRIAGEIMEHGQKINDELQAEIKDKLQSLKAEMGYEYILSYGMGSGVLVADEKYDITDKVLKILNGATPVEGE